MWHKHEDAGDAAEMTRVHALLSRYSHVLGRVCIKLFCSTSKRKKNAGSGGASRLTRVSPSKECHNMLVGGWYPQSLSVSRWVVPAITVG